MIKWSKHPYPDLWGYCVYVWEGTPPWYTGNVLYPMVREYERDSSFTQMMLDTLLKYEFLSNPNQTTYTIKELKPQTEYLMAVTAITNETTKNPSDACYSDVYITKFTTVSDEKTPQVIYAQPIEDKIKVAWKHYAGFNASAYILYVWTGAPQWYEGEGWYKISSDQSLATQMISSATAIQSVNVSENEREIDVISGAVKYYFGVTAIVNGKTTDIYILYLYTQNTWKWIPYGEMSQSIDWGTNVIDFETGIKQYQQKYTHPTRIFTATFSGLAKTWCEIRDFINAHKGNLLPFYLMVDECDRVVRYQVRLAESQYNPKFQTEVIFQRTTNGLAGRKTIGFSVELSFIEVKEQSALNILPEPTISDETYAPPDDTSDDITYSPSLDDNTTSDDTTVEDTTVEDTTPDKDTSSEEDTTSEEETLPPMDDTTTSVAPDGDEWGAVLITTGDTYGHWSVAGSSVYDTVVHYDVEPTEAEWGAVLITTGDTYGHWSLTSNSNCDTEESYDATPDDKEWGAVLITTGDAYGHWSITSNSAYDTTNPYDVTPDDKEWGAVLIATGDTHGNWTVTSNSAYDTTNSYDATPDDKEYGVLLIETGQTNGKWTITSHSNYSSQADYSYTPDSREYSVRLLKEGDKYGNWTVSSGN